MKRIVSSAIVALLVGFAGQVLAEVEKVEVQGQAAIMDNDQAAARDKAIDDALRKAVESAVGTMISSETITENYQLISDKIYSKAEGYVNKYRITDERTEDQVVIVEITAEVSVGSITNDLEALKSLLKRKNMPRVLLMISEQNIGMNGPAYWWAKTGRTSINMRTSENTVMEAMREKGFTFIDTEVLTGKKTVRMPVAKVSDKQAMRVAELTDAEIVIVGQAVAKELGKVDPSVRFLAAQAEVNARVINTDDGKIIAVATSRGHGHQLDAKFAGSLALENAGKDLAKKLVEKISKVWVSETSGTAQIRMTVVGFKNRRHLNDFMKVLRNRIRSVKNVVERRMQGGKAVLSIELAGDARAMATELEAKDFGGAFSIEVTAVSNNAITVKLLP